MIPNPGKKSKFDFVILFKEKAMPWLTVAGIAYFVLDMTGVISTIRLAFAP